MNDSIGVPADSQGTTPITLALVVQNLEHGLSALDKGHTDALVDNIAQQIENLELLAGKESPDPLWWETMDHSAEALDLTLQMIEAEFPDSSVRFMISDTRRRLLWASLADVTAGGAA